MEFQAGFIQGVLLKPLKIRPDARGWLCELFRHDELPEEVHPRMAYVSASEPGVTRGPHEHRGQTDCFGFLGPSNFKIYLWDMRQGSPTYLHYQTEIVGADRPMLLL